MKKSCCRDGGLARQALPRSTPLWHAHYREASAGEGGWGGSRGACVSRVVNTRFCPAARARDFLARLQSSPRATTLSSRLEHRAFMRSSIWRQDRDDWMLHPALWHELDVEFGPFTLDACVAPSKANAFFALSWSREEDARVQAVSTTDPGQTRIR